MAPRTAKKDADMDERYAVSHRTASTLTGLSERQLQVWDASGVLHPSKVNRDRHPVLRIYSFEDLVALRLLGQLKGVVPAAQLQKVQPWIKEHRADGWKNLRAIVCGKELILVSEAKETPGQKRACAEATMTVEVDEVQQRLLAEIQRSHRREPEDIGRITRDRDVMANAWVLAGTRVPTKSIRDMRDEGYPLEEILRQFPRITPADVEAALAHEERLRRKGAA